jgi:tetratricopeptide (TPR) repeat protein
MSDIFSNIEQLEELSYDYPERYFFNARITLDKIETVEKAYGFELPKMYKIFLTHFNGGMILEYEESYYQDMTDFEPDGPKDSSFYFYSMDEMIEKYRTFRLDNWRLDDDFDGIYPLIPVCRTPQGEILFQLSQKVLERESPIFMAKEFDHDVPCVRIASDFNQFLNLYMKGKGFPDLKPDVKNPSCWVFMKEHNVIEMANEPETRSQMIERTTAMIALHPDYSWEYCVRGNAYNYIGEKNKALRDFNKAIELEETEAFFYHCRGGLVLDYGSPRKALIDLDIAVKLDPENRMYRSGRADAFYKLGKLKKALVDCNTVLDEDPRYELALDTRYLIYNAIGDDERANADLDLLNEIR